MKLNKIGLVAAVLAIVSLALPWFTVNMTALYSDSINIIGPNINMDFTAYLYQIQGTVNGTSASVFPNVWFVWGALALAAVTVFFCFAGSFLSARKGQLLLLAAGIAALMAMVVFGAGLLMSEYAATDSEPAAVMNLFPSNAFGISADTAMTIGYHFEWWLSYGFWLTIAAAIFAFAGAVAPSLRKSSAVQADTKTA